MTERKFSVQNKSGEKLVCVEALPDEHPKPLPIVILCHGFAYYKEEDGLFTGIAKRLVALGYAVYYFDFSGCGESEGDFEQTSLTKLTNDLSSIRQEVETYAYIDNQHVSLIGQSFGTNVVLASQMENLDRIVLCGSFYDPYELLTNFMDEFDSDGISVRHRSDQRDTTVGPAFWTDLKNYDLPKLTAAYDCPILFLHGTDDDIVPPTEAKPLVAAAKHGTLKVIQNADHGLQPNRTEVFEMVATFFSA